MRAHTALKWSLIAFVYLAALNTLHAQSPAPFTIRGEARDSSGQKVCGARVCAMPEPHVSGQFFPCALTEADGTFLLRLNEAGKYRLISDGTEDGYMSSNVAFYRQPNISVPEIIVDSNNANPYVQINLGAKSGTIVGKSIDEVTGLAVEHVLLILCHAADASVCFQLSAKNSEGKFKAYAPHVPFTLRIKADGFEDWVADKQGTAISLAAGTTVDLPVYLKRRGEAVNRSISEAEKQPGINLPAPVQQTPADNTVFDVYPRQTKLEWEAVEGAVTYALEVDYCRGGRRGVKECVDPQPLMLKSNPPMTGIVATTYEFYFIGAQPGRWRVWAIDKEGREGFKSPWRKFTYLK